MMRALLISTVSSIALATTAFAADLPNTKGPAPFLPPPPPVFSWTGIYVGVNAGLSGGNFNKNFLFDGFYDGSEAARSSGFSGGGQIGINYEFANNIVIGAEADFQGSTLKGTYFNDAFGFGASAQSSSKVQWWGTARGRIGYAFGNILPYVTGGFAYGRISNNFNSCEGSCEGFSVSGTHGGWTAGAGLEYALTHNLTVKIEYLYTDLGTFHSADPQDFFDPFDSISTKTQFSTVRAGLNWKFDWFAPPSPVVAKY